MGRSRLLLDVTTQGCRARRLNSVTSVVGPHLLDPLEVFESIDQGGFNKGSHRVTGLRGVLRRNGFKRRALSATGWRTNFSDRNDIRFKSAALSGERPNEKPCRS
jgi:hypothetical protein